jgi:hypothetical protein
MRYILGNKSYNTDTAELIARFCKGSYQYTLYVTKKKNYFIEELYMPRGDFSAVECGYGKALEITKLYSACSVEKYFPEVMHEIEEG